MNDLNRETKEPQKCPHLKKGFCPKCVKELCLKAADEAISRAEFNRALGEMLDDN